MPENELCLLRKAELAPTPPEVLKRMYATQAKEMQLEQRPIQTDHVLHAGMYSRTVTLPPFTKIIGVLIKRPTLVITVGSGFVYVSGKWEAVDGYQVKTASANRKQAFVTKDSPLIITMLFPSQARTVEEAEAEFTDETEDLLSRRQDLSTVTITGE